MELVHPEGPSRAVLALESQQRLGARSADPWLERMPDHLSARRRGAPLCRGPVGLPPRLCFRAAVLEPPRLLRSPVAARPAVRRAAVLRALFLLRAGSARSRGPLRRLLGTERASRAHQPCALHAQPSWLCRLWAGLLGSHLE